MIQFKRDELTVRVFKRRDEMGVAAAREAADAIATALRDVDSISMIFAAAPSQNELLAEMVKLPDIPWHRIGAFHMDEYIGLTQDAPQSFARYLDDHLFELVPFRSIHRINGAAIDPEAECLRYAKLLAGNRPRVVCMGIGENGHVAFNDPSVADFEDPKRVRVVESDLARREQQVHDGCFGSVSEVLTSASTLTISALLEAKFSICVVPGPTTPEALRRSIDGAVSPECPASILRTLPGTTLFIDSDSGADYWSET